MLVTALAVVKLSLTTHIKCESQALFQFNKCLQPSEGSGTHYARLSAVVTFITLCANHSSLQQNSGTHVYTADIKYSPGYADGVRSLCRDLFPRVLCRFFIFYVLAFK